MLSILILLILAQANSLVVPVSCWWLFGVFAVLKLASCVVTTIEKFKK